MLEFKSSKLVMIKVKKGALFIHAKGETWGRVEFLDTDYHYLWGDLIL